MRAPSVQYTLFEVPTQDLMKPSTGSIMRTGGTVLVSVVVVTPGRLSLPRHSKNKRSPANTKRAGNCSPRARMRNQEPLLLADLVRIVPSFVYSRPYSDWPFKSNGRVS